MRKRLTDLMPVPAHGAPIEIRSPATAACGPVLLDQWGRGHSIAERAVIGRTNADSDMTVDHSSVSRTHALVERDPIRGLWLISDLSSTNGTFVDGHKVCTQTPLHPHSHVVIGSVSFVWLVDAADHRLVPLALGSVGEECASLIMFGFANGTGMACYGHHVAPLDVVQFALVRSLMERGLGDAELDVDSRGYVRHLELAYTLPWHGFDQDSRPVQQVADTVQAAFDASGIACRIQAQPRRGYRLH